MVLIMLSGIYFIKYYFFRINHEIGFIMSQLWQVPTTFNKCLKEKHRVKLNRKPTEAGNETTY